MWVLVATLVSSCCRLSSRQFALTMQAPRPKAAVGFERCCCAVDRAGERTESKGERWTDANLFSPWPCWRRGALIPARPTAVAERATRPCRQRTFVAELIGYSGSEPADCIPLSTPPESLGDSAIFSGALSASCPERRFARTTHQLHRAGSFESLGIGFPLAIPARLVRPRSWDLVGRAKH